MRTFENVPAERAHVPLLVGIFGASSSGKTYSALRLATGIQQVSGGEIFVIDTESRRSCHYADRFKFQLVEFKAPFGSLDYLAAIQHCVAKGAKVVIVDSLSHEHEGPGGYLMTQEEEIERMSRGDSAKAEKVKFAAWIKPAKMRRELINGILQLDVNLISCFRAKEKLKIRPGAQPEDLGWMPIAGPEFLFEQTATCLLYPGSRGVPEWEPQLAGERIMRKLPEQFVGMLNDGKPLNEDHGRKLAEWAKGAPASSPAPSPEPEIDRQAMLDIGMAKAREGRASLETWWASLSKHARVALKGDLAALKEAAG